MAVHVIPVDDCSTHVQDIDCPCDPTVVWIDPETELPYPRGPLVTHNRFDGRDANEPHDDSWGTFDDV